MASGSAYGLAQGASGAFNSYFVTLAKAFVAGGQGSSIIRLGLGVQRGLVSLGRQWLGGQLRGLLAKHRDRDALGAGPELHL